MDISVTWYGNEFIFMRRKKKYQNGFAELMDYLLYVLMDVEYNRKDYELYVC